MILCLVAAAVSPGYAASVVGRSNSPFATAYSSQRKITRDSHGYLYAVYLKQEAGASEVFVARSTDNGISWSDLAQVSSGGESSGRATIVTDSKDRLYVFWTMFEGGYAQIHYRVFDGTTWSEETALTSGKAYSGYPSVAVDSKDNLHLVWYGYDGLAYQVYYRKFEGQSWSPPLKISQGFPDSVNPTIAMDSHDNPHVACYRSNGREYQIYYAGYSGVWSDQKVISLGQTDSFNPSVAVDRKGRIHLAWDRSDGRYTQIFYSQFHGASWSPQTAITAVGANSANPSIVLDRSDYLYVFYERDDGQIYLRRRTTGWLAEERLTNAGVNRFPCARWAFHDSYGGAQIDYVWTEGSEPDFIVRFGTVTGRDPPTPSQDLSLDAGAALTAAIGLLGVAALYKRGVKRERMVSFASQTTLRRLSELRLTRWDCR